MVIRVSRSGEELDDLLGTALRDPAFRGTASGRRIVGVCGSPGAGKSTVARYLVSRLAGRGAHVPMDGFHLADVELRRQGLLDRKGAPETFDALGYAALLSRLARDRTATVYAPGFDRDLEQPLAGAIAVPPMVGVVVTEGNYLLLDRPEWREVRWCLDEVWHVSVDEHLRVQRLVARHVSFGKSPAEAQAWLERVDVPNARLVEAAAVGADRMLDLTDWDVGAVGQ